MISAAKSIENTGPQDGRWWLPSNEARRATIIQNVAGQLWQDQEPNRQAMIRSARLYGNLPLMGLSPRLYRQRTPSSRGSRLSLNVVKSVCDSYVAMITKDKPKISFVTSGGDWDMQERAKSLEKFCDGVFYEADLYNTANVVTLDSVVFQGGLVKICENDFDEDDPQIAIERIFPWEYLVDDQAAVYGQPRESYQVKHVDKLQLMMDNPEHADAIKTASSPLFDDTTSADQYGTAMTSDMVVVIEAWHLPTSAKAKDGMHCVSVGDVMLFEEKWEEQSDPIEMLTRTPPQMGIWGLSLADELSGIQYEINVLLQKIQRSFHLLAAGHWLIERGSEVNTNQMDNQIGSLIWYKGTPPAFVSVDPVSQEVFAHLDRLYSRAFEIIGISQMAAQSQKPAGLNSGKAILAYADVQSQRFQPAYRTYQHWYLAIARQVIKLARRIAKKHPKFGVKSAGRDTMKVVEWAAANLQDEEFVLKLYPTNAFSDDPVAKMEQVQGLAGMDPATKRLLDFPDAEQAENLADASYRATNRMAESILKEGKYRGPEPFMHLAESIPLMQMLLLDAENKGAPEDRCRMMRKWITNALSQQTPPPTPQPEPAQQGAPPPPPNPMPQQAA